MKKVTFKQFELAVREARQYVKNYDKSRWKICELALSVCDSTHGGRKLEGIFTVKRFADAIEIDHKTLHDWIRVKTLVYDRLPKSELKDKTKYNYEDLRETCLKVDRSFTPKQVLTEWRERLSIPRETKRFFKYIKYLNTILYNAQRPLQMRLVNKEAIKEMITKCDTIRNLLNKELELRENFSSEDRLLEKYRKISKSIKEAKQIT